MQFTTPIPIPKNEFLIDYTSKIISIGSCFAVNMAEKLDYYKFQNSCNPFGILFHPLAIEKLIEYAVSKKEFTDNDVFFYNERWHCFDAHSDLSTSNKDELLATLNAILVSVQQYIKQASHCIITYGTSWVYRNIESQEIVANCHKVPQKQFQKELLTVTTIQESITNTVNLIRTLNPQCKLIFTVSPVRHIKDGFVENQRSKANLISALHTVLQVPPSGAEGAYFPSYEIMMDELRDYRFYADDMLHPNQTAINYIWKRFADAVISEKAWSTMDEVESLQKSLAHKPFNPESESHLKFQAKVREKITILESQYSFMKF
ncbi:GSCFA domain-containing protein [Flavobacterium sp. F-328]|uniref:GSCFA domain-containing protein n=1 Tax=Flavobacterium erciyesense TaxID=2825842 RepID=A0ABS5D1M4_9FLAO|nr:GSCFA domain-containing protein [Flavobacterium erciyesense]MBQ0907920.1 GSCFA domain-containing protein [Flavobacterium erciyesense]